MTIDKIADKLKKNEITYDMKYMQAILEEERNAERKILYLLFMFWAEKKHKRKLYKEIKAIVEELFDDLEEDMSMEFVKRHREGYLEGAFLTQLVLGNFSKIVNPSSYNANWHINKGSFIDDLRFYKNRLISEITIETERMIALKAPIEETTQNLKKPFKKLQNSTKALVDTEMVYAERQGLSDAYSDYGAKKYRYLATLDNLTCEKCGALDGKVFDLKDKVVGANYPPLHPYCRCTVIPVFSDFDTTERYAKDEKGETIEVSMTYEEWKKKYSKH